MSDRTSMLVRNLKAQAISGESAAALAANLTAWIATAGEGSLVAVVPCSTADTFAVLVLYAE